VAYRTRSVVARGPLLIRPTNKNKLAVGPRQRIYTYRRSATRQASERGNARTKRKGQGRLDAAVARRDAGGKGGRRQRARVRVPRPAGRGRRWSDSDAGPPVRLRRVVRRSSPTCSGRAAWDWGPGFVVGNWAHRPGPRRRRGTASSASRHHCAGLVRGLGAARAPRPLAVTCAAAKPCLPAAASMNVARFTLRPR